MKTSEILKEYVDEIAKLDKISPDFAANIIRHHAQVVKAINDGQQLTAKCNIWRSDVVNTLGMAASIKTRSVAHVDANTDADDDVTTGDKVSGKTSGYGIAYNNKPNEIAYVNKPSGTDKRVIIDPLREV